MNSFLQILRAVFFVVAIIVLLALAVLFWDLHRAAGQLRGVLAHADTAMASFATASAALENAAQGQQSYVARDSRELAKTVADAHDLLVHTDLALNGTPARPGLLANLSEAVKTQSDSALSTQAQLRASMKAVTDLSAELEAGAQNLNAAAANSAKITADPNLAAALASFADSSKNVASTTAHLDASAADIQAFIHRETAPVRGTWNTIKAFLRDFAGPAAQIATSVK